MLKNINEKLNIIDDKCVINEVFKNITLKI